MTAFDQWCEDHYLKEGKARTTFRGYVAKRAKGDPLELPMGVYEELWHDFRTTVTELLKKVLAEGGEHEPER